MEERVQVRQGTLRRTEKGIPSLCSPHSLVTVILGGAGEVGTWLPGA